MSTNLCYGIIYGSVVVAVIFIFILARFVFRQDKGTPEMQEISNSIKEGAMAFLKRQYKTIGLLSIIALLAIVAATYYGNRSLGGTYKLDATSTALHIGIAFITGAVCSAIAGYIGMFMAVNANVRAACGAKNGLNKALQIALKGGAVTGLAVTTMSLFGVATLFILYGGLDASTVKDAPSLIVGYGFGASFVALFAQLGGGIYTKAADVGADLVGKVEAGIPEDDPRNPAVIADLVGDNVGDCAGRGADLFESTAAENIGAMILGVALYPVFGMYGLLFPLVARAVGILASIVGIYCVKVKNDDEDPMKSLNKGFFVTSLINIVSLFFVVKGLLSGTSDHPVKYLALFGCALIGIVLSYIFVWLTNYYTSTSHRPVKNIAKSCTTGSATNIITGVAVGMESTALPVLFISAAILGSYFFGTMAFSGISSITASAAGLYGTAIATMGMLSSCAYILAMDTFGPITDNAGGITEMSGAPESVRIITDRLDACGNTTKALTKGYAVASAALATFLLFSAYMDQVAKITSGVIIDLAKPEVFVGAFIAAMTVFLFSSTAIRAVGRASQYIVIEVRRQFKEISGIMEGTTKPEYAKCVDIVTRGALKEMVLPGIIVILAPILVGVILGKAAVGAFLLIGTITGVVMALFLNNSGGAWDNAKKLIELGEHGGKGSEAHKASITGDTVGDPFKDTAGPSLHVFIKLISTIALLLVVLFR